MFAALSNPIVIEGIVLFNLLLSICAVVLAVTLKMKLRKMFGDDTHHISEILSGIQESLKERESFEKEMRIFLEDSNNRVNASVKSPELLRFEPFKGISSGGNQSFSLALVDERGDGLVLSGLNYSRERVSIFAKPVSKYISSFELTPEEKEVLDSSKKKK